MFPSVRADTQSSRRGPGRGSAARGVTTVALEASGTYGHVLARTLAGSGFAVVVTSPAFTRQT